MENFVLSQEIIQENICQNLSVEEIVCFLKALYLQTFNFPVVITDRIVGRNWILPGINPLTLRVYQLIQQKGASSALIGCVFDDNYSAVELLLECGVSPDSCLRNGTTALMWSVMIGHNRIVQLLLRYRADPNLLDDHGENALMKAAKEGRYLAVQFLVKYTNLDQQNNEGMTALMWAAINGYSLIVALLLEYGANINLVNNNGENALSFAIFCGSQPTIRLLQ